MKNRIQIVLKILVVWSDMVRYIRFYNQFLGTFPKKIIIDNRFEIMENTHKISAHKIKDTNIYIANIQHIMLYYF